MSTAGNTEIDARLSALRADMETLQKDLRALAGAAGDVASTEAKDALKKAEALAKRAYDLAEDTATQAKKTAFETAEDVEEWAAENAETLRSTVREQPLTSLAIAAGVGAFLALFLRR